MVIVDFLTLMPFLVIQILNSMTEVTLLCRKSAYSSEIESAKRNFPSYLWFHGSKLIYIEWQSKNNNRKLIKDI